MTRPKSIIVGIDGMVMASPKTSFIAAPYVRKTFEDTARRDRIQFPDELWDWVAGLELMAAKFAAGRPLAAPLAAVDEPPLLSPKVDDMKTVTKRQAASLLHCSPRLCRIGLPEGRWQP